MAAKRSPVSDSDIQAIIRAELAGADGQANSELAVERGMNMDYYQGRPFGNEMEGRSSVVSSDVADTVEWILPTLIRIFCSGEDSVEFEPETEQDVAGAKQATEYINFIWNRDNRGFVNFYSWFKDAILQKNGVLKIWWDDTKRTKRERYSGLDDAAFALLVNDPDVEVSEHTEDEVEIPVPEMPGMPPQPPLKVTTHDLVITRTLPGGRVCVVPVPPEEFLISRDARSIEDARLVGHKRQRYVSELIEEGFDRETVERLSGDDASVQTDFEAIKRNTVETQNFDGSSGNINPSMRRLWVTEAYIKADVDGDGIAEMRKVVVAGPGSDILSNESWDTPRPFAGLTPIIMPHRFWGLAVADLIRDIQLIKSTIMRQYLDNLYLQNNAREQVIETNIVDPSELLSSAPGRKIRIKNGEAIFPIVTPDVGSAALAGLEYIDQIKENRTGVSQRTSGLDSDSINDETATKSRQMMSAAMGKIELIARIFAETGVKDAFRLILKLVCMYQDQPRTIRLTKGQWAPMDPSQWNSDMDMTVRVGMGMGDRDQQLVHAQLLGQMQAQLIPLGFISPDNLKNAAEIAVTAMGMKGVDRFITIPQGPAAAQPIQLPPHGQKPGQDPQTIMAVENVKAQAKVQAATQTAQMKAQTDNAQNQLEAQRAALQAKYDMALEQVKIASQERIALETAHINAAAKIGAAIAAAKTADETGAQAKEQAQE